MWEHSFVNTVFKNISNDAKTPLYLGSTNFTRLSTMLRLMNLKAMNGLIEKKLYKIISIAKGHASIR